MRARMCALLALSLAVTTVCFAQGAPKAPRGQVATLIEGSVNPRNIGNGMKRFVEVSQDTQSLNTFARGQDGKERVTLRMWERVR